jgi:hypothetical protein
LSRASRRSRPRSSRSIAEDYLLQCQAEFLGYLPILSADPQRHRTELRVRQRLQNLHVAHAQRDHRHHPQILLLEPNRLNVRQRNLDLLRHRFQNADHGVGDPELDHDAVPIRREQALDLRKAEVRFVLDRERYGVQ